MAIIKSVFKENHPGAGQPNNRLKLLLALVPQAIIKTFGYFFQSFAGQSFVKYFHRPVKPRNFGVDIRNAGLKTNEFFSFQNYITS